MKISVAILEIQNPGNLGAIARVMKNFDLKELILINPKCKIDQEAIDRASHAKDILKKSKVKPFSYLKKFDYVIGTTAKLGRNYNIPRTPLPIDKIEGKKIVILFGREDHGLSNKEIKQCDLITTIPSSKKYPTLNISHAAAIIFYELFKNSKKEKSSSHFDYASRKDKDILIKLVNTTLKDLPFSTKEKRETQKKSWKSLINKAFLTKREIYNLCGFFSKIKKLK